MITLLLGILSGIVSFIISSTGYGINTWQWWAITGCLVATYVLGIFTVVL